MRIVEDKFSSFDGAQFLEIMINNALMNNEQTALAIKVCNKYGIFGTKAVSLLMELGAAAGQMKGDADDG